MAAEPPAFDYDAIERLVHYATLCEQGWRDWFAANSIEPLEMVYEELIKDLDEAVRDVARFLDAWQGGIARRAPGQTQPDQHS